MGQRFGPAPLRSSRFVRAYGGLLVVYSWRPTDQARRSLISTMPHRSVYSVRGPKGLGPLFRVTGDNRVGESFQVVFQPWILGLRF